MKDTGKVDLAKISLKNREHIATLRIFHDVLVIQILLYAGNIVRPETFNIPRKGSLDEKELALATKLIRYFLYKFSIDSYHDEFMEYLMKLIKAKITGKEIKVALKREA